MSAYNDREKASSKLSYGSLFHLAGKLSCFGYIVMKCAERIVCHTVSNIAASNTVVALLCKDVTVIHKYQT